MRHWLAVAALLALGAPPHAEAQRTASVIATPGALRVVHSSIDTYASRSLAARRDTTAADTAPPNVAAWSALGGALAGGALGYAMGVNCSDLRNVGPCQRTVTIGGAVVGALIGYGFGSIVDMGIAHDRARARERAAARGGVRTPAPDSAASTSAPTHP